MVKHMTATEVLVRQLESIEAMRRREELVFRPCLLYMHKIHAKALLRLFTNQGPILQLVGRLAITTRMPE